MNLQNKPIISVKNITGVIFEAIEKEINILLDNNILEQHQKEKRGPAWVLNTILQEHTLRYILVKAFYEFKSNRSVKFDTEVNEGDGPIDLVFYENKNIFAFEIKRWQANQHKEIKEKDLKKLESFREKKDSSHCYELIFTNNQYQDVDCTKFKTGPKEYYKLLFEETFKNELELIEHKVILTEEFLYCIYLAKLI